VARDVQKIVLRGADDHDLTKLAEYEALGGYKALAKARAMTPEQVTDELITSELRGRGGAFFPTGRKWSFVPPKDKLPKPHYLVVNADESEPGSFKDNEIMARVPHRFIEGCLITAHAIDSEHVFVYIRGEYSGPYEILVGALEELRNRTDIRGDVTIVVHRGAGAYICGEETALMESLEGRRGNPRIKPPFPAVSGVFGMPTTINNVETLIAAAPILLNGAEWYKKMSLSSPKSTGTKLYSVCGNVQRPGTYEVVMGFPFKEFLYDLCGGPLHGRKFKAVIPGGASVPIQNMEEAEATLMDYEGFVAGGSMLGSGGVIVIDDAQPMVTVIARLARFFAHESCGQCTQCREGTAWTTKILERIRDGEGTVEDLDTLLDIGEQMTGKTICVLSDSCAVPVVSGIKKFRGEFEALIQGKRFHPVTAAVA